MSPPEQSELDETATYAGGSVYQSSLCRAAGMAKFGRIRRRSSERRLTRFGVAADKERVTRGDYPTFARQWVEVPDVYSEVVLGETEVGT